jgi:ABC-type multidrug transport system ATPase subunit
MSPVQSTQFRGGDSAPVVTAGIDPSSAGLPTTEPVVAAALDLKGIVKSWKGPGRVLDHVDLVVRPGTAIHLSGQNGCGKTTLLRIAVGLIRPEAGAVSSGGLHPERDRRSYQQRIGFLAAGDRALYARMTARDHLKFWARLNFIPRKHERDVIERALITFGLKEIADRRVDRISMGQRQRVRLGGSFLHDPSVVLLDEPRNSLDDAGIELLSEWAQGILRRNGAVIWCSPNGESAEMDFSDRYVLYEGHLTRR